MRLLQNMKSHDLYIQKPTIKKLKIALTRLFDKCLRKQLTFQLARSLN